MSRVGDEMKDCVLPPISLDNRPSRLVPLTPLEPAQTLRDEVNATCFIQHTRALAEHIHATAISKGWWDEDRNDGELIALMHSELSEALEALRAGNPPDDHIPQFSGAEAELADVIIRALDMSSARGYDVAGAIVAKCNYNQTREIRHGGKHF